MLTGTSVASCGGSCGRLQPAVASSGRLCQRGQCEYGLPPAVLCAPMVVPAVASRGGCGQLKMRTSVASCGGSCGRLQPAVAG